MRRIPTKAWATRATRRGSMGVLIAGLVAVSGCSPLRVQSLAAPTANFSRSTTFWIMERPERDDVDGVATVFSAPKVMLNNSIMDQMVRNDIRRAFEARGYRMTNEDPDLLVAYYSRASEQIEIDNFGYGYPYGYYRDCCFINEFTEGIVVIDVLDPSSKELLWRGSATREVSDNPQKYAQQLNRAIGAIVARFPPVMTPYYREVPMEAPETEPTEGAGEGT